jgi:hypothetical protein
MQQLTIRGFDGELLRCLTGLAKREGISLNQAAIKLLRMGAGLDNGRPSFEIGDAIKRYAGVWTADEAREFELHTASFNEIDPDMWT